MENNVRDFIVLFTSILYEAIPFIVLGAVIAGVLEELVPQQLITRVIPRRRGLAIAMSALLGLIFPMCECGIIPVMRRLLRKGLPLSCCVAYMLAGPIINFVVILSTVVAFSGMEDAKDATGRSLHQMGSVWMVSLRVGIGYLVAIGTALVVERVHRRYGNQLLAPLARTDMDEVSTALAGAAAATDTNVQAPLVGPAPAAAGSAGLLGPRKPFLERLGNITETALHDFVDITVFLTLGALLSAFVRQLLTHQDVEELSRNYPGMSVAIMMGLAVCLCLCSEADAFVAASFKTMQPAAKLAFLVLGPMLDFKLYLMYTRIFRPRLIWTIISCVVVQVYVYAMLIHFGWNWGILEGVVERLARLLSMSPSG